MKQLDLFTDSRGPILAGAALEIKTWLDSITGVSASYVREVRNVRTYAGPERHFGGYIYTADVVVFDGLVETVDINPTLGAGSDRWHDHGNGGFYWDDYATSKQGAWVRSQIRSETAA